MSQQTTPRMIPVTGKLNQDTRAKIMHEVNHWLDVAEAHYGRKFDVAAIRVKIRGRVAGRALFYPRQGTAELHLSVEGVREHLDYMIDQTIPHEVAHVVQRHLDRTSQAHGALWQSIMRLFGKPAKRCHDLPLSRARDVRNTRPFRYVCGCREHYVGHQRHRRAQAGTATYKCTTCRQPIQYRPGETRGASEPVKKAAEAPRRPETPKAPAAGTSNGIPAPKPGGKMAAVWALYDELYEARGYADRAEFVDAGLKGGHTPGTVRNEFSRWKRHHGL